jgi:hypothetical protein
MPLHSFALGQVLEFNPGKFDGTGARGAYTIVRLLPNDGRDREYRVKNVRDGTSASCGKASSGACRRSAETPPGRAVVLRSARRAFGERERCGPRRRRQPSARRRHQPAPLRAWPDR